MEMKNLITTKRHTGQLIWTTVKEKHLYNLKNNTSFKSVVTYVKHEQKCKSQILNARQ